MRKAFIESLIDLAEQDPRILLLTGDLGFTVLEPFQKRFPTRFYNVGVAEQNMIGLATGMAEAGYIPFVYSIGTFATLRGYEFIRNGPAWHRFPVRIIGIGGGVEYGHNGISHYSLEDVAVMRVLPGMTVIAPADCRQARQTLQASRTLEGPIYYRLSKNSPLPLPVEMGDFQLDRVPLVRQGSDLILLAMGPIAEEAIKAADLLESRRVSCAVGVVACVNAAVEHHLADLLSRYPLIATVEAHSITGGLGSWTSEIVATRGLPCRVIRCGIPPLPGSRSGSQSYLYDQFGLSGATLADRIYRERTPKE